jgi:ABC-type polysaccharide/polyol phosphate export permease
VPVNTGGIPYPVFSYVAVIPWTFLSASLSDMASSLVNNMSLVNKIYFPREVLVLAAMLARFMDFLISVVLLAVLMFIYQVPLTMTAIIWLPIILFIEFILIVGLGLALAAANVFFRDVTSLLALGLQLWFYASPIIYPITAVPVNLRTLYFLNPMAGIIEAFRAVLLAGQPPNFVSLGMAAVISVIALIGGYEFFKRVEFRFADIV